MGHQKILVVEDDKRIRALLRNVLEHEGFRVLEAATAAAVLETIETTGIDLITLDLHLGADNGLEVARDIRRKSQIPIVMVTGRDDVIDRVVGLEIGADDYITKPFHIREVVARIRSVLRRAGDVAAAEAPKGGGSPELQNAREISGYTFDGLSAAPDRFELIDRAGVDCALTSGDFKLLTVFLERPKRVLSRDQLMDLTGGQNWSPLDRAIDNQIARLRKKIERDPSDPKLIKTVRGVGYTLACDVKTLQSTASSAKSA